MNEHFEEVTFLQEVLHLWIVEIINNCWETCKVLQYFIWVTVLQILVATMNLSVSFL